MLTLAAHQASIWGYDAKLTYDGYTGYNYGGVSTNFIGTFTTPTLAPNGNLYAIQSCYLSDNISQGGLPNAYTIAIITPGNTNSSTTNWSAATVEYITADGSANRPTWNPPVSTAPASNSAIRFLQKGILAANGKIYFPPFVANITSVPQNLKWVVLTPGNAATTTWEVVEFSNINNVSGALGMCVAGKDGYLYVLPNADTAGSTNPFFRIHPKNVLIGGVTATADTAYIGYWSGAGGRRLFADYINTLTWRNSAGTTATDTATGSVSRSYPVDTSNGTFADAIAAPNGNIYMLPRDKGRGRIFYIKPSNFGTAQEICSETGLHINQIAGGSGLYLSSYGAHLESKDDTDLINLTGLKIYITPNIKYAGGVVDSTVFTNIIVLNPALNTLSKLDHTFVLSGNSTDNLAVSFPLANGTILLNNIGSSSGKSFDQMLTGEDVATTKIITGTISNGIIANTQSKLNTIFGIGNAASNRRDIGSYHAGVNLGKTLVITNLLKISELVSVKGYHPGVTYFNSYLTEETGTSSMYKIPTNSTTVPLSLYNTQKNKPK